MAYPNITTNFSSVIDFQTRYQASYINALQTAVNSIIAAMPHKQQVVVVAKARGDYNNFASAAAAIPDASASKPYSILLMPGIYETSEVALPDYVSVVGVDQKSCVLKSTIANTAYVLKAGNYSVIQNVGVVNSCVNSVSEIPGCIYVLAKTAYIYNCYVENTTTYSAGSNNAPVCIQIEGNATVYIFGSLCYLSATTKTGECAKGIFVRTATPTVIIKNSHIEMAGSPYQSAGLYTEHTLGTVYFNQSEILSNRYGIIYDGGGTIRCENSYINSINSPVFNPSLNNNNGYFYDCTLVTGGSTCFEGIFPSNIRIAHCRMNLASPIHDSLTNLIDTPYNVMDTDV